jgi:hypothetical protein
MHVEREVTPVLAVITSEIGSLSLPLEEYSNHVHNIAELQMASGIEIY